MKLSKYDNVLKKEETKKEKVINALKEGMSPREILNAKMGSIGLIYRYRKELENEGYNFPKFTISKKEPKNEVERIQFEHNKTILNMKCEYSLTIPKLTAITDDPYYMQLNEVKSAITMSKIWEKEGWKEKYREWIEDGWKEKYKEWIELGKPKNRDMGSREKRANLLVHSRDLHYQIDKKYYIEKFNPKTRKYESLKYNLKDPFCWKYCVDAFKYAKQIGLIPNDALKDQANPDPENVQRYRPHEELDVPENITYNPHDINTFNNLFDYKHIGELIKDKAKRISKELIKPVRYDIKTAQPNHLELWCEKSEIIPFSLAKELDIEIRECGTGEASDMMCYDAVIKAKESGKNLVVGYLSDFDIAGEGMPLTASRKIQFYADKVGIQALVYPIALNFRQIKEYGIPYSPPEETNSYEKAYAKRVKDFKDRWDIDPIEINAFKALKLDELKQEIRNTMIPHYDDKLSDKIEDAKEKLRIIIVNAIKKSMRYNIHKLKDKRKRVRNKRNRIKQKNKQQENVINQCETLKEVDLKKYNDLEANTNKKYDDLTKGYNERKDKYVEALKILENNVIEKHKELIKPYKERKDNLEESINILKDKVIKPYNNKKDKIIEELEHFKSKKENRIDDDLKEYKSLLEVNISEVLEGVKFQMPKADVSNGENALLNTNRSYMEQLERYNEYKKKCKKDEEYKLTTTVYTIEP